MTPALFDRQSTATSVLVVDVDNDKPTVIASEPRLKSLLDEFVKRLGND